jgi:uncharacterized protein (DUF362 family)
MTPKINRRQLLKLISLSGASLLIESCLGESLSPKDTPVATNTSLPPTMTPSLRPTSAPVASATPAWQNSVSVARAESYDPALLRKQMETMFQSLGGLGDIVKPGAKVGIKLNLTGGTWWDTPDKPPANEYFVTHPAVAGALAEILRDLGASRIILMDGLGDPLIYKNWGYTDLSQRLGLELLDLDKPAPYSGFKVFPVGENSLVFPNFQLNPLLGELDVFISLAKMKCHTTTGVTLALKNLIGIAPTSIYRRSEKDTFRSAFHGDIRFDTRLPRVIIDLNRARPVHLAIIDGIRTAEAGAGPWDKTMQQVKPGLLFAGKNSLAVDTVATAAMGFNPLAASGVSPFVGGENHLSLAAAAGLGTNQLEKIQLLGATLAEVSFPFKPAK